MTLLSLLLFNANYDTYRSYTESTFRAALSPCGCAVATIKRENFVKMKAGINDTKVDTKNSTDPNLEELTERQRFIYNFISDENSEDGTKTAKSLTPKLGVSISTVKRELKELQIKGYLEHIGPSNGGYWKVLIKK